MFNIEEDEVQIRASTINRHTTDSQLSDAQKVPTKSVFRRQIGLFWVALRSINVEIVVFLVYLAWAFGKTLQAHGLYRRVCETYYMDSDNCSMIDDDDMEISVQRHVAEWCLFNALAYLIPALFVDIILGAYGDKYGRQINILFGICGVALSEFGFLLILSETIHAPYYISPAFGLIAGMTGYITMLPVSSNAYLADITDNSDLLTIRAGVLSASQSLATVIGGWAAAFTTLKIGIAIDIELFLFFLAFIYTLIRIPQQPGHRVAASPPRSNTIMTTTSCQKRKEGLSQFFLELLDLLKSGFHVYTRRRVGHRRAFMTVCILVLMITYTTSVETMISPVMSSYVFRRQDGGLAWTTREFGMWNGTGYFILFAGTLIFLPLFKRVFHWRETTIILISMISSAARCAIIGFSTENWHMYVAQAAGIFSGMTQPAVASFIVQLVPYEEIGRVFSLFGIGADCSFIITNLVYNNIYRLTVDWFPGFMYEFIAGFQLVVFGAMLWVHFHSIRERIGDNRAITRDTLASRVRAISTVSRPDLQRSRRDFLTEKRHSLFTYE